MRAATACGRNVGGQREGRKVADARPAPAAGPGHGGEEAVMQSILITGVVSGAGRGVAFGVACATASRSSPEANQTDGAE